MVESNGRDPDEITSSPNGLAHDRFQQSDLLLEREGGGGFLVAKELFTGSADPTIYLPRTRISDPEIARNARLIGSINSTLTGDSDLPQVMAYIANARVGLDGKGRDEVVQVAIAENQRKRLRENGFDSMMTRAKDINRDEVKAD